MKIRTLLTTTLVLLMMLVLIGCNGVLTSNTGLVLSSQNAEEKDNVDKVMETFEYLFDCYHKLDGELAKKAFLPNATLYCSYYSNGITAENYCDKWVPNENYMSNYHEWEVLFIDITGSIATAKIEFHNPSGRLTYTKYFSLRYDNASSSWKIINANYYEH